MAVVATSTPKRHGFSIESLIGRDDSPRRQQAHTGILPRPEDFSTPKDLVCRDRDRDSRTGSEFEARDLSINNRHVNLSSLTSPDYKKSSHHARKDSPPTHRDSLHRDVLHGRHSPISSDRELLLRHRELSLRESSFRDFQRDMFRDRGRSPHRPGTVSPSSTTTEEDRRERGGDRVSSVSPIPLASSSPRLTSSGESVTKATTPSSASPESENRLSSWNNDDLKNLLHSQAVAGQGNPAAFHHGPPHLMAQHHLDSPASLYQPLRACNRSLSAAMSSLIHPQFANINFNALQLYNIQREMAAAAHPHHPAAVHPLMRYHPGGGMMHPRFPLGPQMLFHPYRKPKRNRTAFSPNQLLQLEQAFEKNHYVVGQERKGLASKLSLTETQVKVWFQNRRTKHKRMKAEEEQGGGGVTSGDETGKTGDHSDGEHMDNKSDVMSDGEMPGEDQDDDICLTDDEELFVTEDS